MSRQGRADEHSRERERERGRGREQLKLEFLDLLAEGVAVDLQVLRRLGQVAAVLLQHPRDEALLELAPRISEADALEETYQHYAVKVMPRVPYPTIKGIQMVLDEIGTRTPKAKSLSPASFIDVSYLKELEQGGFIKKLYGE